MRFFVDRANVDEALNLVYIDDSFKVNHICKSLRMGVGDTLECCIENENVYNCEIIDIAAKSVGEPNSKNSKGVQNSPSGQNSSSSQSLRDLQIICKILYKSPIAVQKQEIDLFQGIVKSSNWEYLIQKSVEFGVNGIYPVATNRCVAKYDAKKEVGKIAKLQAQANAAAVQSFRSFIPQIYATLSLKELHELVPNYDLFIVAYENMSSVKLKDYEFQIQHARRIGVFIGPEGGFDRAEIEQLSTIDNVRVITLGDYILRANGAGAFVLAQIAYIMS